MNYMMQIHPLVTFLYYAIILNMTLFLHHPAILLLSFCGAILFYLLLVPSKVFFQNIVYYLFFFVLLVLIMLRFIHKGETILFFFNDLPITFETLIFGVFMSIKIVAIIFWLKTFSVIMSTDKIVYLFGNVSPKLSIFISFIVQFFSTFKQKLKEVSLAHKTLGLYTSDSFTDRISTFCRIAISLIINSIELMAVRNDIMKVKGYGQRKRTNFALFRWKENDIILLTVIIVLIIPITFQVANQYFKFYYFPVLSTVSYSTSDQIHYLILFMIFILPTIVEVKEGIYWMYLKSKI